MKARPYSRWISRLFILSVAALSFTGFFQMPLAKRYYLTEVPGMAWTGDMFIVHRVHYVLAALFLFLLGIVAANWFRAWRGPARPDGSRPCPCGRGCRSGRVRRLRVYRNLPDVTLHPAAVMTIEWVHLISWSMVLGVLALAALVGKSSAYAVRK